ncbi:MAG: DUF4252 domain-containing protein, partial [Saprospiraceae bacterium]|nr:DUF4252 domain-containing protein [Saprospiraceae bacterium]
ENGGAIPASDVARFMSDLEQKDDFQPLVSVRSKGQRVHIMMQEKKDILKSLLILVDSEDAFMMLSLKTKLNLEDIIDLVNLAISGDMDLEEVEVEEDEIVLPRA